MVLPQRELSFSLEEIELDASCYPYRYFLANRFAFTEDNLLKLIDLVKHGSEEEFSIDELLEQTQIQ